MYNMDGILKLDRVSSALFVRVMCARVSACARVRVCVCVCVCAHARERKCGSNASRVCASISMCACTHEQECKCGSKLQIKNVSQIWVFGREHVDVQQFVRLLRDPEAMRDGAQQAMRDRAQQRPYLPEFCHPYLGQDTFAPRLSVLNREPSCFQHSYASVSVYVRVRASTAISSIKASQGTLAATLCTGCGPFRHRTEMQYT
jgi:hypothetical protein